MTDWEGKMSELYLTNEMIRDMTSAMCTEDIEDIEERLRRYREFWNNWLDKELIKTFCYGKKFLL